MSVLNDIKQAVSQLRADELAVFRAWFAEFDAARWDRQFDEDATTRRLDRLAAEALRDDKEGRCTDL